MSAKLINYIHNNTISAQKSAQKSIKCAKPDICYY